MAIRRSGPEVWISCDNCRYTVFAGLDAIKSAFVPKFEADGWTFDGEIVCPWCNEESGRIKRAYPPREAMTFDAVRKGIAASQGSGFDHTA